MNPLPDAPKEVAFAVLRVPFFLEPHADETKPFVGTNRQRLLEKWGGPAGTMHGTSFCSKLIISRQPTNMEYDIRVGSSETTT
jgi:hypothetical protein